MPMPVALPSDNRCWIVGMTGSIGMGKSTVANMFRQLQVPVSDSDADVHTMYASGGLAVSPIGKMFPDAVQGGAVCRAKLSAYVIGNDEAMQQLEAIVHPLVEDARQCFLTEARNGQLLAVLDIPLLFEKGLDTQCDEVLVVSATAAAQRSRVLDRPNMTLSKFESILARQVPDLEKRSHANTVIDTACSLEATREAVCAFVSARRSRGTAAQAVDPLIEKAVTAGRVSEREPAPEPATRTRRRQVKDAAHESCTQKKQKRGTQEAPSLTGAWLVIGRSASSGDFEYEMDLKEEEGGGVSGEVKSQDMRITGTIDRSSNDPFVSFTQVISGSERKTNTCTATLAMSSERVPTLIGQYKSSSGGKGSFRATNS